MIACFRLISHKPKKKKKKKKKKTTHNKYPLVPLNEGNQHLHYYFAILISFSVHQFINLAIRTSLTNIRLVKTELRFLFLSRILVNLQETTIIWSLLKSLLQLLQKSHLLMVRIPFSYVDLIWILTSIHHALMHTFISLP